MAKNSYRFDSLLAGFPSDFLKKMAATFGGGSKLRKDQAIEYIHKALADPPSIDLALSRLEPYHLAALRILDLIGGEADLKSLALAAKACVDSQALRGRDADDIGRLAEILLKRGTLAPKDGYLSSYYPGMTSEVTTVFADGRILARVTGPALEPMALNIAKPPSDSTYRSAQNIMLDAVSVAAAIRDIGGIGMTKSGDPRVVDVRKVARKLGWEAGAEFDALPFPDATQVFISGLQRAGILPRPSGGVITAPTLDQLGTRSVVEISRGLFDRLIGMANWTEYQLPSRRQYGYEGDHWRGRLAAAMALRCLPERTGWYLLDDFERSLFERIGGLHSVVGVPYRPHAQRWGGSPDPAAMEKWRIQVRASWEAYDVPWLRASFQTWMYAFGLVEIGLRGGEVEKFRLTDLGRAVLLGEPLPARVQSAGEPTGAWVVQPNFDMVVYLDAASVGQIAFLEQYSERLSVARHSGQYRLTRDSVYDGLQAGGDVDTLIETLTAGSRVPLPGNVVTEIRTWAALRKRMTARRRVDLVEFADDAARSRAIAEGAAGSPIADRFLLLSGNKANARRLWSDAVAIDYLAPAPRCLQVSEEGVVTLTVDRPDLLTPRCLDAWADRDGAEWRLTRSSVSAAVRRGGSVRELWSMLGDRLTRPLPEIVKVAIQGWVGEPGTAGFADVAILQCRQSNLLKAVLDSKALKPYLLGKIGSDAILVDHDHVDDVKALLEWAGVTIDTEITARQ